MMAMDGKEQADRTQDSFPVFLSVVVVLRNQGERLPGLLEEISGKISGLADEYELIIVDNASDDDSVQVLKKLTGQDGLPNLLVLALTSEADTETSFWVGMENAIGDFAVAIDPMVDDIHFLPSMLKSAMEGADMVFASNEQKPTQGFFYRKFFQVYSAIYKRVTGVNQELDTHTYRVISRQVVNFVMQHPIPAITYRHLPSVRGFIQKSLRYSSEPRMIRERRFWEGVDHGIRLFISTTRGPMRLVTLLSLFGAGANLLYSMYVIAIAIWKEDVEPGWITLSLQATGMFFLFSLVFLVLGEYILNMARLSNEGPQYHVSHEFTSAVISRKRRLNVEEGEGSKG